MIFINFAATFNNRRAFKSQVKRTKNFQNNVLASDWTYCVSYMKKSNIRLLIGRIAFSHVKRQHKNNDWLRVKEERKFTKGNYSKR